jgi:hypothetical protein
MRLIIALLAAALIAQQAHADESNEDRLRDALRQAVTQMRAAQTAALQAGLAKWQAAYNTAAELARTKDEESQRTGAGLKADMKALDTCKAENAKLIDTAETILHLYQTQGFRSILLRSYEPLIGSAKVTLENTVQDYDDKIHDQEYVPPAGH